MPKPIHTSFLVCIFISFYSKKNNYNYTARFRDRLNLQNFYFWLQFSFLFPPFLYLFLHIFVVFFDTESIHDQNFSLDKKVLFASDLIYHIGMKLEKCTLKNCLMVFFNLEKVLYDNLLINLILFWAIHNDINHFFEIFDHSFPLVTHFTQ